MATEEVKRESFTDVLSWLDGKNLLMQCESGLEDLVTAVRALGQKGSLTLKLAVKRRSSEADCTEVVIVPELRVTIPQPSMRSEPFFTNGAGHLARDPWNQASISFKRADGETA